MSPLERLFLDRCRMAGLPTPVQEHRPMAARNWRFDFAWPERQVALEVEGGTWANGRHNRGRGYESDARKYNAATLAGWRVLRATGDMVRSGEAVAAVREALGHERG
jgi:very-short-patch-repair endonuclease